MQSAKFRGKVRREIEAWNLMVAEEEERNDDGEKW